MNPTQSGEAAAAMGDMLVTEREKHQVTMLNLANAIDRLEALGEDASDMRSQEIDAIMPRDARSLNPLVSPGLWRSRPMMRRIMNDDETQVVAQFVGVRGADMDLMAMAPELAGELTNCIRLLRERCGGDDLLTPYFQHLEGGIQERLFFCGWRKS